VQHILSSKLLNNRRATVMLGVASAVLAAIVLLVYLSRYRESLNTGAAPTSVLVAKSLITKGTSVSVIGSQGLTDLLTIPQDQVKNGAVSDPATIKDRVAVADIYPGQQITLADFSAYTTSAIPTRLIGDQRAISIPFDSSHGMIGQVAAGDHVDIYVGVNEEGQTAGAVLKLLFSDIYVLSAPGVASGGVGSAANTSFVFQVKASQAPKLAFASDHGTLWIVLRPTNDAKPTPQALVTIQSLLKAGG
jgi:Flp pilus assembly protein CpaB